MLMPGRSFSTQLFLSYWLVLISTQAITQAVLAEGTYLNSSGQVGQGHQDRAASSRELGEAFDDAMALQEKKTNLMDRWFGLYSAGKISEADAAWKDILNRCKNKAEIGDIIEAINTRCWFAETGGKANVDPEKAYEHLLASTTKQMGKEHRFNADIAAFLATYAEAKHEYKRAEAYRLMDLRLHEKALGPEHRQVAEACQELAHLLIKMKRYKQAEHYLQRAMKIAAKNGFPGELRKARLDYVKLLDDTGSGAEAKRLRARFKIKDTKVNSESKI